MRGKLILRCARNQNQDVKLNGHSPRHGLAVLLWSNPLILPVLPAL